MSQGSVVEISQPKSIQPTAGEKRRKFRFLIGAVVFIALAVIGVKVWPLRPEGVRRPSQLGANAELTVGRVAGQKFPARVVGTAQAINPTAKRLLTELEVPNQSGDL